MTQAAREKPAEAQQEQPAAQPSATGKSGKRRLVLAGVLIALVAAGAAAAWSVAGRGRRAPPAAPHPRLVSLFDSDATFNLADPAEYLVLNVDLEVKGEEGLKAVEGARSKLADALIKALAGYHIADLTTAEGKEALSKRLVECFNAALKEPLVAAVYFTTFVTQKT